MITIYSSMQNKPLKWPMKLFCLAIGLLFFWIPFAVSAEDEEGSDEIHHIKTVTPHYYWFYKTALGVDKFKFILNDGPPDKNQVKITKHQDYFHIRFDLQEEENTLAITSRDDNETLLNIRIYNAPPYYTEDEPDDIFLEYFHSEAKEAECVPCHRLTPSTADYKLGASKEQICFTCHRYLFEEAKFSHSAADPLWLCLICHESEPIETDDSPDGPVKFMLEDPLTLAPLCYKCHLKFSEFISSQEYVHGPLVEGGCGSCHSSHFSEINNLLHKKATPLCVECHDAQDMLEMPVVHAAITQKGCTGCHSPHASNFPMQLRNETNKLCFSCHPQILELKDNHPLQHHPTSAPVDPSYPDRPLTCVSCHTPHSSEFNNLLPEEETMKLCSRCHKRGPSIGN